MHRYYKLNGPRILGASLHIHWSVWLAAAFVLVMFRGEQARAPMAICCYFGVILLHEFGHALLAKRLGYQPLGIYLTAIHGVCQYEHPDSLREDAVIAWGGVLVQLIVAIPLILVGTLSPLGRVPYVNTFIAFFGHYSLVMALFNLIPLPGLDGAVAWRIVPMLFREARQNVQAKRTTKALLRRLK